MPMIRMLVLCALVAASGLAQSSSGITGQVVDLSKAAVPNAEVVVTGVNTGVRHRTITNGEGYYTVPSLPVETYTVSANLAGFNTAVSAAFKLDAGVVARIDLTLSPQGTKQAVEVSAAAPLLQSEESMLGSTVTNQELAEMPLEGRNVLSLVMSMPAVGGEMTADEPTIEANPTSPGSGVSVGGGRITSAAFLTDGAGSSGIANGRATVTFSPDTVQEMNVSTSTFSAQYGSTGGGVISIVSKSGTNTLHGTAYWFQKNPFLQARTFGTVMPPGQRRNDTGFVLGGPVVIPKLYNGRNKTFFLFSLEPKRVRNTRQATWRLPTAAERNGDFRNWWVAPGQTQPLLYRELECWPSDANCTQFKPLNRASATATYPLLCAECPPDQVGRVIPAKYLNPLTTALVKGFPLPNMAPDASGDNYVGVQGNDITDNRWNLKIDQQIGGRHRLSGRFTTIPISSDTWTFQPDTIFPAAPTSQVSHSLQQFLSHTWTITPRIVNEARASYLYGNYSLLPPSAVMKQNFTRDVYGLPSQTSWGMPSFNTGAGIPNVGTWPATAQLGINTENQYQYSDDLTLVLGRHTVHTGVDLRQQQLNMKSTGLGDVCCGTYNFSNNVTQSGNANSPGGQGGLPLASFMIGVPATVWLRPALIPYYYRWNTAAAYVQDDFKLKPNLTLNLGVRYQYNSPRAEKFGRQANVDLANPVSIIAANGAQSTTFNYVFTNSSANPSSYLEPTHKLNFEPRIGFAWTPDFSWNRGRQWVVRGGYGINHLPQTGRSRSPFPDLGGRQNQWTYTRWTGAVAQPLMKATDPTSLIRIGFNAPVTFLDPNLLALPADGKLCMACLPADPRLPGGDANTFDTQSLAPYIQTWNLTVQRQLPAQFVVTASYLGTKGTHLFSPPLAQNQPSVQQFQAALAAGIDPTQAVPNPYGPGTVPQEDLWRPFPTMGSIRLLGKTNSDSIYHAGAIEVQRRFRAGLAIRFNYTRAKSIDDSSDGTIDGKRYGQFGITALQNPSNLSSERAVSIYDQKHRINYTASYELPFGTGKPLLSSSSRKLNLLVGGWTVNAIGTVNSGYPFAPRLGTSNYNGLPDAGGDLQSRPDCISGGSVINPRWNHSVANSVPYFNPTAFAQPAFGILGNCARVLDYARAPWARTLDMSVTKVFYPFESRERYIQLRAEFFNALNHPAFYFSSDFGKPMFQGNGIQVPAKPNSGLAGPIPYCPAAAPGSLTPGSREATLCNSYNPNFGMMYLPNNLPGRTIQLALKLYW